MTDIADNNNLKIRRVTRTSPEKNRGVTEGPDKVPPRYQQEKKDNQKQDEAKDHLSELKALVDWANRECEKNDSRYRFRLRVSGDNVFIDVVVADAEGKIKAIMASEITHEEVLRTVEHIREGEGILFDMKG